MITESEVPLLDAALDLTMLDHAIDALRRGFRVFPLRARTKDGQLLKHGCLDASSDESQILEWWAKWPDANVAITGGSIVDADTGLTCLEDAQRFALLTGLPPTLTVRTGRRSSYGVQFHYTGTTDNRTYEGLRNGVSGEVRCRNQYGLFPGSIHPETGEVYEFVVDLPRAEFPVGVLSTTNHGDVAYAPLTVPQIRGILKALVEKIPSGGRNNSAHAAMPTATVIAVAPAVPIAPAATMPTEPVAN